MNLDDLKNRNLILASASPRRIEIFNEHGLNPKVRPSGADETLPMDLTPEETVMFLSLQKSMWLIKNHTITDDSIIISADTIVVFDGEILGKPKDSDEAYDMLNSMSGKTHYVYTGICIHTAASGTICSYGKSTVKFRDIPGSELKKYINTDEPYDKAGGYAIQGTFSKYATLLDGDMDNVIGFPFKTFESTLSKIRL